MRDENGFLDISDYLDLGVTLEYGNNTPHWLSNDKNEYVFKVKKGIRLYRELLYPIILRNIKVNTVDNDIAIFNGQKGIISKSYHSSNTKVCLLVKIICQYCIEVLNTNFNYELVNSLYNISDMITILKWFCAINNSPFFENLTKNELLMSFIMQILLANKDNSAVNREMYFDETLTFSPYFDFENYGDVNLKRKKSKNNYRLDFYTDRSEEKPKTYIETIEHFKHYATKEEMETFMFYLEQLKSLGIQEQFIEAEDQIHAHIPLLMKLKLKKDYESNLRNVSALIKKV